MSARDPELVVFTPLPPSHSGIADYVAELLPLLGQALRIVAVVAGARDVVAQPGAEVVSEAEYRRSAALARLPHLFQIGNNLDHAHVYRAALRTPGIVVLHELVLHHLVEALTLGRGDAAGYEAVLAENYGPAGRRLARLRRLGLFQPGQRFLLPLHAQVLEQARGVLVHSRYAASRLQAPQDLPVRVVPHHLSPRVAEFDALDRAAARQRLGLPEGVPVLLSLGHATPAKQIDVVLEALALLRRQGQAFRYVIGGEPGAGLDLPHLIRQAGLEDCVQLTGWLAEADFFAHARAADLLVNLRFPPGGESSGALARALGMGLPALVYDCGPLAEYPDAILAKLAFGPERVPVLAAAIATLLADPAGLVARGQAARDFMRRHCSVEASCASYLEAIRAWG
jgi:glycosyltransferase involved in cell wall biosynthesis